VTPESEMRSFQAALNEALAESMQRDPTVFVLGEDVAKPGEGIYGVTRGLEDRFGRDRVLNTPILEQGIIGLVVGAALGGLRPVAEMMLMDYLVIGLDQLVNHAAKMSYMTGGRTRVPMTVRTNVGGAFRGAAQHSQSLEAWLMHIPGIKIAAPSTPADAKGLLTACIEDENPCVMMEYLTLLMSEEESPVPVGHHAVPLGKAAIRRAGSDATLISYGRCMTACMAAADVLAEDAIETEVIDLRSIVPLDLDAVVESVFRTRRAAVVTSSSATAGVAAEISALLHERLSERLHSPVVRLGAAHVPMPFVENLERMVHPTDATIVSAVRMLCRP
jgi:pyruvate/2-oxoglutarate/acetoin dehydrogenase E1 component